MRDSGREKRIAIPPCPLASGAIHETVNGILRVILLRRRKKEFKILVGRSQPCAPRKRVAVQTKSGRRYFKASAAGDDPAGFERIRLEGLELVRAGSFDPPDDVVRHDRTPRLEFAGHRALVEEQVDLAGLYATHA